jgi:hypothetical protein
MLLRLLAAVFIGAAVAAGLIFLPVQDYRSTP